MKNLPILLLVFIFSFFSVIGDTKASNVTFEAHPLEIIASITQTVNMNCSVTDSQADGSGTSKLIRITSIFINRHDGTDMASITAFTPSSGLADIGNMEVKGYVSSVVAEGYLELSWKDPSLISLGGYTCFVNGIDVRGHPVVLTGALQITLGEPSVKDLVLKFASLQNELESQTQKVDDMTRYNNLHISNLTQQNDMTKQALLDQKTDIDNIKICLKTKVAFMAVPSRNFNVTSTSTSDKTILYDNVITDTDSGYNSVTGQFKVRTPGVYFFSVDSISSNGNFQACLHLKVNSDIVTSLYAYEKDNYDSATTTALLQLKVDDVVYVAVAPGCNVNIYEDNVVVQANVFTGHLIHNDRCLE